MTHVAMPTTPLLFADMTKHSQYSFYNTESISESSSTRHSDSQCQLPQFGTQDNTYLLLFVSSSLVKQPGLLSVFPKCHAISSLSGCSDNILGPSRTLFSHTFVYFPHDHF